MSIARWFCLRHHRTSDLGAISLMSLMNSSIKIQGDRSELWGDCISSLRCKGLFDRAENSYELSQPRAINEKRRCGGESRPPAHRARMAPRRAMAFAGCSLVTTRIGRARAHRHHGAPSAASCDRSETYECHLLDELACVITRPVISRNLLDESNKFIN